MTTQEKEEFIKNEHEKISGIIDDFKNAFPLVKGGGESGPRGGGMINLAFVKEGDRMISSSSVIGTTGEIVGAILEASMRDKSFGEIIVMVYGKLNKYITAMGSDEYLNLIGKQASKESEVENVNA